MQQIKDTVKKIVGEIGSRRSGNECVARAFEKAFSRPEKKHLRFIGCKNKICVVNVDTSGWLYHLSLKKERVRKLINEELGGKGGSSAVDDIRFRIGEV
ncbi:MAG: DciA family protein [Candidatus Omnitrophica bacterium]|nr:DciA family protein [Candidatus Omnitrophota bacterium]MDD5655602.1 DciA family protein [Candidatus Omnitrophota bacterium]